MFEVCLLFFQPSQLWAVAATNNILDQCLGCNVCLNFPRVGPYLSPIHNCGMIAMFPGSGGTFPGSPLAPEWFVLFRLV